MIPPLPHLVWRRIMHFLADDLTTLLNLSSLSLDLQRICRPYASSFFHTIAGIVSPLSWNYHYHDLLWLVLQGHIDASAITEFYYVQQWRVKPPITASPASLGTFADSATERQKHQFDRLLQEAVRKSLFIPPDLRAEVCTRYYQGDQDAALAIFLPLCTRLKLLEPPIREAELCTAFFESLAKEHQRRGTNAEAARRSAREAALKDRDTRQARKHPARKESDSLPFSEVVFLHVGSHQHGYSFPLSELLPFMAIPSLQRIIICGARDKTFPGWPAGDLKPSCPEIYFEQSSITREAVLAFAQGLTAPCEIRQWYERPRADVCSSEPEDPDWDRVLVKRDEHGSKSVEVRLDYEGGNPGYDYAWVSWLWHGNMQDWRRLDEDFALEEGDEDVEWLQGLLA